MGPYMENVHSFTQQKLTIFPIPIWGEESPSEIWLTPRVQSLLRSLSADKVQIGQLELHGPNKHHFPYSFMDPLTIHSTKPILLR